MKIKIVNIKKYTIVFLILLFFGIILRDSKEINIPPAPVQTVGSVEDLEGRSNYNWMRLHSPKTGEIPRNIRSREIAFAATLPTKESLALRLNKPGSPNEVRIYNWARRGPFNVGGRTRALAIDVADSTERTILAGGVSGGMWKTTNGGNSWTKTTGLSDLHSVTSLVQDIRSGKTDTWYYGTGEWQGNSAFGGGNASYRGDGIFKSTDGGMN
ncbi:hypothetical protein IIB79_09475, partial [candidate division KSB1 bacterium]|nr:hypothetical protein [candidate division KSB1 bacterium]